MTRVQQRASVHESTIQQLARDTLPPDALESGRYKPYRQTGPGLQSLVRKRVLGQDVHDKVWAEVERILDSGHGYTTVERISDTEMVVR